MNSLLFWPSYIHVYTQRFNCATNTCLYVVCTLSPSLCLQVDLVEIKQEFLKMYHKTLYKMIEGDTSGDYRK